ncbi:hypothetical protein A3J78_00705 [Candidatus Beckwithbacteria bacterium RBG_13_35_6]|uniref:Import component protein n=1 Tax=Candidatus Beckwithbacteria bacterium RBG_13_35_6 TaxID=1797456 RepID=A0A1F5DEW5_9BACT|nr:MAG: hypothetical protein A3J78_00705 [Candidatus Beckwithbacteria bacterium RBG_13_35_6]
MTEMSSNVKSALCYVGGWLTGLIFLLIEKKDKDIRFHAIQSILTFGGLTILIMVPLLGLVLAPLAAIFGFILWLVLIIKTYQGEKIVLPLVGEFAKKQVEKV